MESHHFEPWSVLLILKSLATHLWIWTFCDISCRLLIRQPPMSAMLELSRDRSPVDSLLLLMSVVRIFLSWYVDWYLKPLMNNFCCRRWIKRRIVVWKHQIIMKLMKVICGTFKRMLCVRTTFLGKPEKLMCIYHILFLEFNKYYWFFEYNIFMKMCRIVCHFIFSKIVNFAKMAHTTTLHCLQSN